MLARIAPDDQKQVSRVLEWLSFSLRHLLLDEVAELFILDPDSDVPFNDDDCLVPPSAFLELLSGLVTEISRKIVSYDDNHCARRKTDVVEIRLAHFLINEYLVCAQWLSRKEPYRSSPEIPRVC